MIAGMPEVDVFAKYEARLKRNLMISLGVLALALVRGWSLSRAVVQPITDLAGFASFAAGETAARASGRQREVVSVAQEFNRMPWPWNSGAIAEAGGSVVLPLLCPRCGCAMRTIAFITEAAVIQAILGHLCEPKSPLRPRPARGPPLWEMQDRGADAINPQAQPMPDHEFGGQRHRQRACRSGVSGACRASSAPNQRLTLSDMAGLLQKSHSHSHPCVKPAHRAVPVRGASQESSHLRSLAPRHAPMQSRR